MTLFFIIGFFILTKVLSTFISNKNLSESEYLINVVPLFLIANLLFFYFINNLIVNRYLITSYGIFYGTYMLNAFIIKKSYYLNEKLKHHTFVINACIYFIIMPLAVCYLIFSQTLNNAETITILSYDLVHITYPQQTILLLKVLSLLSCLIILFMTYNKFNFGISKKWLIFTILLNIIDVYLLITKPCYSYGTHLPRVAFFYVAVFVYPIINCVLNIYGFHANYYQVIKLLFAYYQNKKDYAVNSKTLLIKISMLPEFPKRILFLFAFTKKQKKTMRALKTKLKKLESSYTA